MNPFLHLLLDLKDEGRVVLTAAHQWAKCTYFLGSMEDGGGGGGGGGERRFAD